MENNNKHQTVVIVSRSVRLRDLMRAMLKSIKGVDVLDTANELNLGMMMAREHQPSFVFLDVELLPPSSDSGLIAAFKRESPQMKLVVLIDYWDQNRKAVQAGANSTLMKGFSISQLDNLIDSL